MRRAHRIRISPLRGPWPEEGSIPPQEDLFEALYAELRSLAADRLRAERQDHTLQPTALLHEAWLRLAAAGDPGPVDRHQYRALAARVLRNVLIDHDRGRRAQKRGGGLSREPLESNEPSTRIESQGRILEVEELERALQALEQRSPRQAQVIEMRFYGELSFPEIAACLEVSVDTAKRDWRIARAWLNRTLDRGLPEQREPNP